MRKTRVLTGVTSGFGAEALNHLVKTDDRIIAGARNPAKRRHLADEIGTNGRWV